MWNAIEVVGPDVPGTFPLGFVPWARRVGGRGRPELHVCAGTVRPSLGVYTVDIRPHLRPSVVGDGTRLPFCDEAFEFVLIDPPYSERYSRELYQTEYPKPQALLQEAARVLKPEGRMGLLHQVTLGAPPGCHLVHLWGVSLGQSMRMRAFALYERDAKGFL